MVLGEIPAKGWFEASCSRQACTESIQVPCLRRLWKGFAVQIFTEHACEQTQFERNSRFQKKSQPIVRKKPFSLLYTLGMNSTFQLFTLSRAKAAANVDQLSDIGLKLDDTKIVSGGTVDEWDELYACGYCDQAFTNSTELMEHREIHSEINEDHTKYMEDSS